MHLIGGWLLCTWWYDMMRHETVSHKGGSMRPPMHTQPYPLAEAFSPKDACPVGACSRNLERVHASACGFTMLYAACIPYWVQVPWKSLMNGLLLFLNQPVANVSINRELLEWQWCIASWNLSPVSRFHSLEQNPAQYHERSVASDMSTFFLSTKRAWKTYHPFIPKTYGFISHMKPVGGCHLSHQLGTPLHIASPRKKMSKDKLDVSKCFISPAWKFSNQSVVSYRWNIDERITVHLMGYCI